MRVRELQHLGPEICTSERLRRRSATEADIHSSYRMMGVVDGSWQVGRNKHQVPCLKPGKTDGDWLIDKRLQRLDFNSRRGRVGACRVTHLTALIFVVFFTTASLRSAG